jgi:hypothetical protein
LEPESRVKRLSGHPISSLPKQFCHPFADFLDICIPVECVAKAQSFHKTQSSFSVASSVDSSFIGQFLAVAVARSDFHLSPPAMLFN